jgi:hemerythrin-like metal-binding protein
MTIKITAKRREGDRRKSISRRNNYIALERFPITGFGRFDEENRALFEMLKELIFIVKSESDPGFLRGVVLCMERSILRQFTLQEKIMRDSGYPVREEHFEKHKQFILEYFSQSNEKKLAIEFEKIINWFDIHIQEEDKKLSSFLLEKLSRNRRKSARRAEFGKNQLKD